MKLLSVNYRRLMADFRSKCESLGGRGRFNRDNANLVGMRRTHDIAIAFRMNAGFAGDVNRSHPVSIEPCLIDSVNPPTGFGQGVIADAAAPNGVRIPAVGDSGVTIIYGITVRPFPFQQSVTAVAFGATTIGGEAPAATGPIDVMRSGYIMVPFQGAAAATKGGAVKMCVVAGTGYKVGFFSTDTVSGTFASLAGNYTFNGPADSAGNVELCIA